jgi:hypothetical protein
MVLMLGARSPKTHTHTIYTVRDNQHDMDTLGVESIGRLRDKILKTGLQLAPRGGRVSL